MTPPHPRGGMRGHTGGRDGVRMPRNVEIRIRGTLPAGAAARLGMTATADPADTLLRGVVEDRPALLGVLERLRCNNIELIDVRRLPDPGEDGR
jgi:hypothetical protein